MINVYRSIAMKLSNPIARTGICLFGFFLLFLSVYAYACVLPMMSTAGHHRAASCCIIDCRTSCFEETVQKHCESLKRMESQNSLILQGVLPCFKLAQAPPLSDFTDLDSWPQPQLTLHTFREAKLYPSIDLYTFQHALLL